MTIDRDEIKRNIRSLFAPESLIDPQATTVMQLTSDTAGLAALTAAINAMVAKRDTALAQVDALANDDDLLAYIGQLTRE